MSEHKNTKWISPDTVLSKKAIDKRDLGSEAIEFFNNIKTDLLQLFLYVDKIFIFSSPYMLPPSLLTPGREEKQYTLSVSLRLLSEIPNKLRGLEPLWRVQTEYVTIELPPFSKIEWEEIKDKGSRASGLQRKTVLSILNRVLDYNQRRWTS